MLARLDVLKPLGLLLARVVVGAVLMAHGFPKLFDSGPFLEAFPKMGFPAWTVYVAGLVEFFGGLLLVLGLFTRVAAFFISGQFFVAFVKVHWKLGERAWYGFLGTRDEYPLVLCVLAFLLLTAGAGAISLDRLVFKDKA